MNDRHELTLSEPEILEPEVLDAAELDAMDEEEERRARLRRQARRERGMTLVEILIVLTILAGIMVTVGVVAINQLDKARIKESEVRLNKISNKVQEFYAFQSPSKLPDDLNELVNPPGGEPPYMKEADAKDAWGRDVIYNKSGDRNYELRSAGPDGSDGTDDDIVVEE